MRGVLLRGHQLRDDMLILRGLLALRRFRMAFDLADDGQAVDDMPAAGQRDRAQILDLFFFQPACVGLLRFIVHMLSSCVFVSIPRPVPGYADPLQQKTVTFHKIFFENDLTFSIRAVYF